MKIIFREIEHVFDTGKDGIPTLVIENQNLLCRILTDITEQLAGNNGTTVLSENVKEYPFDKNAELIDRFIPFDINTKTLLTKVTAALEKTAVREEFYLQTMAWTSETERYLHELAFELPCTLSFTKMTIGSLIKAAGICIEENDCTPCEKLLDYFQLVTQLDRRKLFILLNFRSYFSDDETQNFLDTVRSHCYNVLMIESSARTLLPHENRVIVDADLCEIC